MANPVFTPPPGGVPISKMVDQLLGGKLILSETPETKAIRSKPGLVHRDLAVNTIQNTWSVDQCRGALYAHMAGNFDASTMLYESIMGDDRVTATLGSRVAGLFGREALFRPANDSAEAKACLDAWKKAWPRLAADSAMRNMHRYAIGLGFAAAQLVWDTDKDTWQPRLIPWSSRYTYFDWQSRLYKAQSMDGPVNITPGDNKWVLHAPYGDYRGWIHGAVRAIAEPWMLRHFAFRDMARFSEIHGLPTRVGRVPAVSDPVERAAFQASLANLGSDTTMMLPKGVDGQNGDGYDYELVEAKDTAWQSFPGLIDRCDMAIVLALMFQNLTTEVQGGSYGATKAHMDIRQGGLQDDDAAWAHTIYEQIARPFAWLNFGDPDLAPWTNHDVAPKGDADDNGKRFQNFTLALETFQRAGIRFTDAEEVRSFAEQQFGVRDLPKFTIGNHIFDAHSVGATAAQQKATQGTEAKTEEATSEDT